MNQLIINRREKMKEYSIEESAKLLWQLIDLGLVLNFRYKDSGIVVEDDNEVTIKLPKIIEVAEDWKEFPYLTKGQKETLQCPVDGTREVVTMVNYYMEQEYIGKPLETEPLVKLLGDRLLVNFPDKLIVVEN